MNAAAATGPPYRLSPFQRRLVLTACPAGAAVAEVVAQLDADLRRLAPA